MLYNARLNYKNSSKATIFRKKRKRESVIGKGKIFYENHIIDFTSFATIKPTRTCIYNNRIAGKETKIDSIDKNLRFFNNFILYQSYI